jgi:hypothetical protein
MFNKFEMNSEINPRVGRFSITPEEMEKLSPEELAVLQKKVADANAKLAAGDDEAVIIEGDAELARLLEEKALIAEAEKKFDEVQPVAAHELGKEIDEELAEEEEERMAA